MNDPLPSVHIPDTPPPKTATPHTGLTKRDRMVIAIKQKDWVYITKHARSLSAGGIVLKSNGFFKQLDDAKTEMRKKLPINPLTRADVPVFVNGVRVS